MGTSDRWARRFVAALIVALAAVDLAYVASCAGRVPWHDDIDYVQRLTDTRPADASWLFASYGGHRMPLVRAIAIGMLELTQGDFRVGGYLGVLLLAAAAALNVAALRRVRGRTVMSDAFVPLVWLTLGHFENLLVTTQLQFTVPMALVGGLVAAIVAWGADRPERVALAALVGAGLAPLCGGVGLSYAPAFAGWALLAGLGAWFAGGTRSRFANLTFLAGGLATAAITALYILGTELSLQGEAVAGSFALHLRTAARFVSLGVGSAAVATWPFSLIVVLALSATTAFIVSRAWRDEPRDRLRIAGLAASLVGLASAALAVSLARAHWFSIPGAAPRYFTMHAPFLTAVFACAALYGRGSIGRGLPWALLALAAAQVVPNTLAALKEGRRRAAIDDAIHADLSAGVSARQIGAKYAGTLLDIPEGIAAGFAAMRASEVGPFWGVPFDPEVDRDRVGPFASFTTQPDRGRPARIAEKDLGGRRVVVVPLDGELEFALAPGAHRIRGVCGATPSGKRGGRHGAVQLTIECRALDGSERRLFERSFDVQRETPEQSIDVAFESSVGERLVLSVTGDNRRAFECWWSGIALD